MNIIKFLKLLFLTLLSIFIISCGSDKQSNFDRIDTNNIYENSYTAWVNMQPIVGPNGPPVYISLHENNPTVLAGWFVVSDSKLVEARVREDGVLVGGKEVFEALTEARHEDRSPTFDGVDVIVELETTSGNQRLKIEAPLFDRAD